MGKTFEDLEVWRRGRLLAVEVCRELRECGDWGIRNQITRSAVSVPSNVAEGAERNSPNEFALFAGYAKGSLGELRTQLMIASDLGYIPAEAARRLVDETRELSRMLHALIRSIRPPST